MDIIIQNKQMDKLRWWARSIYDNVVEDDYLEPLSQSQVYSIINKSKRRLSIHYSDGRKNSLGFPQDDLINKIQTMAYVSPQRQFRILGLDPRFEVVTARVKELKEDLDEVKDVMVQNFPKYKATLNRALSETDSIHCLENAKDKSKMLKQKITRLEKASERAKKITFLNIKIKNIKKVLKVMSQIPNIKKMSLYELKAINVTNLRSRETLNSLECLNQIEGYIESAVAKELGSVIHMLEECLVKKFSQEIYENALKNFIIADHQKIRYERLLIKLVEKQIRKGDTEIGTRIYQICLFYINLMINLHGVFRWHRLHEDENEWQFQKVQREGLNIHLDTQKVKITIVDIMDECMKDLVLQKFYRCEFRQILQIFYLVHRISSISEIFSGRTFKQTISQMKTFIEKKLKKLKQKSVSELRQTLALEQMNKWNRLPVSNDYSHDSVDRNMYQIFRHRSSEAYKAIPIQELASLDEGTESISNGRHIEENWQIQQIVLLEADKFQKYRNQIKLNYDNDVVICQSALAIIKFLDSFAHYAFYFPLKKFAQKAISQMFYLSQFYIFYIFHVFVSTPLKNMFFQKVEGSEMNYSQKRISILYGNLFNFLRQFKKASKISFKDNIETKEGENIIRLRVVATQSVCYINAYLQHILTIIGKNEVYQQRIEKLKQIQNEMSEIVFTDSISKIGKLENTQSLTQKIRWSEDYHYVREYLAILMNNFQQFYYKMRAINKGEVPLPTIDRIFCLYWKSQINTILKIFLLQFKPSKNFTFNPKTVFQKFIDDMYNGIQFIQDRRQLTEIYEKIKRIFPIILEGSWQRGWQLFKVSLLNYDFIYRIEISLIMVAECTCHLSVFEANQRKSFVERWIDENLLGI